MTTLIKSLIDPAFEQAVQNYLDRLIEQEKREFKPGLEPFSVHATKIRQKVSEGLHCFQKSYQSGYQILIEELSKIIPQKDPQVDPLESFRVNIQNVNILENPDAFVDALAEGKAIYELLGFSPHSLQLFYKAACQIVQENRFSDAKEAFFFLVTLAPTFGECWLGLGFCALQCQEFDTAIYACSRAIDLNPTNPDSYFTSARVFIQMKDFDHALKVCDLALVLASENRGTPWADELEGLMQEAKRQINLLAQK